MMIAIAGDVLRQPGMFPALLSVSSAGPASQAARGSVSPWPPAPAAPNASRMVLTCTQRLTQIRH